MKKRLLVFLCTFAIALGLTGCGTDDNEVGGRAVDDYYSELSGTLSALSTLDESGIDYNLQLFSQNEDGAALLGLLEDYKECYDKDNTLEHLYNSDTIIGGVNIGDYNFGGTKAFSVEKSGKTITATLIADFSQRDLKMTFVYKASDVDGGPTAMNIEPVYSLGETMQKAGLNTVMGILIVFFMLVVMSGVIKGFEIIPKLQKKSKEKKESEEIVTTVSTPVPSVSNKETDDLQLVAVIAAAIAASTGASTDSFVVRSIKKR